MAKKKVVVGMSGGVDSSVAAYLLKEQGYDVIGVTMQIWQDEDRCHVEENGGCCGVSAVRDASAVAQALGIPYYVLNFKDVFRSKVMDYFALSYYQGRTPNPCIACNRYVKWQSMLQKALSLGADFIATGHYAQVVRLPNGRYTLKKADHGKDQTYALYNLTQEQLARTLMPLGKYTKAQVRAIAESIGLPVANKPDSQEICFVEDRDYAGFLTRYTGREAEPGHFVDTQGRVLGNHRGIIHYTIGQRKGLGIALGRPMFVVEIRPETRDVVLGEDQDCFSAGLLADDCNWMLLSDLAVGQTERVLGKIRYSHEAAPCTIVRRGDGLVECRFEEKQRAVTPGQAVVWYRDGCILGGGCVLQRIEKGRFTCSM